MFKKNKQRISLQTVVAVLFLMMVYSNCQSQNKHSEFGGDGMMLVKQTKDFTVVGDGSHENWDQAKWINLDQRANHDRTNGLSTRLKVLYSEKGMYFLFQSEDEVLSATFESDFEELWYEDVVEIFLWTDDSRPHYFEYEVSPLNYELPLIVSNIEGELLHWIPFANSYHVEHDRYIHHKTSVQGGEKESGAKIESWTAEIFIPFKVLHPLENIFPVSGTKWKANFYRIDYDYGMTPWSWQPYETNFHDYGNFGTILFE
jgi:hypothetical protein